MGLSYFVRMLSAVALAVSLSCCAMNGAPVRPGGEGELLSVEDYRLGPGDEMRIVVFGQEQMTGQFIVGAGGAVVFPLVGDVPARGLTINEFNESLVARLREGYVRQPSVTVEVTKYRPFYILGEVQQPGTYPFSAGLTVMRAVATAGGFSYRANSRRVFIQHSDEASESAYELTSSTPVQPGDTVRIPERRF